MESDMMKRFNEMLSSIHECKVPSKSKIQEITKAALKAKSLFKFVVFSIEKFLMKCKPEHRLPVLYIIDSIIRASQHQFKEKDVFAPRFLKVLEKILKTLLTCKPAEQLKVIRTLNLWLANGVYTREEIEPFREQCRATGLEIDFEVVERAVKKDKADMRIYAGKYMSKRKEKEERSTTPPMPPPNDGLLGAAPNMFGMLSVAPEVAPFPVSDEITDGIISERDMYNVIRNCGNDRVSIFLKDANLLQQAHRVFVDNLRPKVNDHNAHIAQMKALKARSIKNVLTKDFEYSDDEDEKEQNGEEDDGPELMNMTHDTIIGMAQNTLTIPSVIDGLMHIANERIQSINNATALLRNPPIAQQQVSAQLNAPQFQSLGGPPGAHQLGAHQQINPAQLLQGAQLNPAAIQQAIQQGRLPLGPPPNLNFAQLQGLQNPVAAAAAAQQMLGIFGNQLMNLIPGAQMSIPPGAGAPPPGGINLPPMGVPPPVLGAGGGGAHHDAQQQQLKFLEHELAEAERENGRAAREEEKAKDRERRKMGLPAIKSGVTYIASRTLWLKKVPPNCSENDLKMAVESCGEAQRIKIISNRACAYVTMETRKSAYDVMNRLKEVTIAKKDVKFSWARGTGMNDNQFLEMFDSERGIIAIPFEKLPLDLEKLCEGAVLDIDSLPEDKRPLYTAKGEFNITQPPLKPKPAAAPVPPPGIPPPRGLQPPGIPPQFQFQGIPLPHNMPPPPGVGPPAPNFGLPPTKPPGPPPPGMMHLGAPPPPGASPFGAPPQGPPPSFDPHKPPPMSQFGAGGPGGPMQPFRGGFQQRGGPPGFRGNRGGFMNRGGGRGGPPPMHHNNGNGRFGGDEHMGGGYEMEHRRDQGDRWQHRDRDRSSNERDRRSARYEDEQGSRRRTSRWGRDDENDRRRSPDRSRRDRDYSPERRSSRSSRRTPPHPADEVTEAPAESMTIEERDVRPRHAADEETVSSTTLDDQVRPAEENAIIDESSKLKQESIIISQENHQQPAVEVVSAAVAVAAHAENSEEVPMDLE